MTLFPRNEAVNVTGRETVSVFCAAETVAPAAEMLHWLLATAADPGKESAARPEAALPASLTRYHVPAAGDADGTKAR